MLEDVLIIAAAVIPNLLMAAHVFFNLSTLVEETSFDYINDD